MAKYLFNSITLLYLLINLIGCSGIEKSNTVFFGGKIINPKTKFVVLYSNNLVIDTILLNERNKFLGIYKDLDEGLYHFMHGNENQYIYLEPKDSLMLRLNTWNFDESLVFAGKGAERNNILVDIFLEDESEKKLFYQFNNLKPKAYQTKINSHIQSRLKTFDNYKKNHPKETTAYFNVLKTALTYPMYARIERYPISHVYVSKTLDFPEIDSSFYAYRKDLDFNDNNALMYYTPYARYITNYLYNVTYALGHKPMMSKFSSDFTVDLLQTIDAKINLKDSKNAFLKRTVLDHFQRKSNCNIDQRSFDAFLKLSSNKKDKELVRNLLEDNKTLHKGHKIGGFTISDFTDRSISIKDFTHGKNTVLLFWSKEYISKSFINSRVPFLQRKYPSLNFAVIEIDGSSNSSSRIPNIDIKNQYYMNSKLLKNNFLTSAMHRTILVNKKGVVENGYAAISSQNIYKQLKELSEIN
ncbi:MAG: hypothetical protein ACI6PN_08550 [Polaribacter sp.]|uniref:hypothetical protein n=1 Tax=Polaribacter sp. TaxID=1920175 RepID=UPI00384BCAD7